MLGGAGFLPTVLIDEDLHDLQRSQGWIRPGLAPWMTMQPRQCFFVDSTGVGVFGPVLLELNDDY